MVLLSFLLVLAAAVTLVIGLLNGGLGLIYLSIACSLGAGIVLALAVVRSRPRAVPALGGPAPIGTHRSRGKDKMAAWLALASTRTTMIVSERSPLRSPTEA